MNRFIVGGASDFVNELPKALYKTGTVIGVNDWFLHDPLDIWLSIDSALTLKNFRTQVLQTLKTKPIYVHGNEEAVKRKFPINLRRNIHVFRRDRRNWQIPVSAIRHPYDGKIVWLGTSCMAAIHLAICLGATEIVLAGFDCYGDKRWDGYVYKPRDLNWKPVQIAKGLHIGGWTNTEPWINRLFQKFTKVVKIYKTRKESPLKCEYLDPHSDYALNPK